MDKKETYLGDGVYAKFDGHHVWLAVNEESNYAVALDPAVFARLCEYVEMLKMSNVDFKDKP